MSIFNQPIDPKITGTLSRRQNLMGKENRNTQELSFLNSKTAWVSLKSSVNVNNDGGKLAKDNILSGGGLNTGGNLVFGKMKSGITSDSNGSYSLKNSDGSTNVLGVRPMPGITSVSVDNIGAYGSLRKATINFQCWDIKQLEILEKLYMRPGYTILLEFGRTSYINEKGNIVNTNEDLTFFTQNNVNLHSYLNKLYTKSKEQEGNYDAFFGYITNYGWNARSDGGYDCKTEIISTGELLESLKVNYSLAGLTDFSSLEKNPLNPKFKGLILPYLNTLNISSQQLTKLNKEYSENVISGLMYELYLAVEYAPFSLDNILSINSPLSNNNKVISFETKNKRKVNINYNYQTYQSTGDPKDSNDPNSFNERDSNVYITLRSFVEIFNTFILPKSFDDKGANKGELVSLSVDDRLYVTQLPLLCLYNSLMISTNPDVCWIKNKAWYNIISGVKIEEKVNPVDPTNYSDIDIQNGSSVRAKLIKWIDYLVTHDENQNETIINQIKNDQKSSGSTPEKYYASLTKNYAVLRGGKLKNNPNLYEWGLYTTGGGTQKAQLNNLTQAAFSYVETFGGLLEKKTKMFSFIYEKSLLKQSLPSLEQEINQVQNQINDSKTQQENIDNARTELANLSNNFKAFNDTFLLDFVNSNKTINFGNIGNIYINLKHLYKLSKDPGLLSQDSTGHNKISAVSFLKRLMQDVQISLGNVNQFEIHIDPIDGIGRIIDLNYINLNKKPDLFKFEIGSNKSIVRDLKLESQIFSDQSSIIAISAQQEAGKLGSNNSTLVGFNDGITDRMILKKDSYLSDISSKEEQEKNLVTTYISSLSYIVNEYLKNLLGLAVETTLQPGFSVGITGPTAGTFRSEKKDARFNLGQSSSYSNSLRDIMYFFTSVSSFNESNKDKQFIPTLLSLTIDGLSGFIIGNLFKVDNQFVPNYYKKGDKLAYILTKINHELSNNDWITTISGYPFNLESNENSVGDKLLKDIVGKKVIVSIDPSPIGNVGFNGPKTNVSTVNQTFNDVIQQINNDYKTNFSSIVSARDAQLNLQFLLAMKSLFEAIANNPELKTESIIVTSMIRDILNLGSKHGKGEALDFTLGSKGNLKPPKPSSFTPGTDLSKKYSKEDTARISNIYNFLTKTFPGAQQKSSYALNVNGLQIEIINEYFHPSVGATGPHFHFEVK